MAQPILGAKASHETPEIAITTRTLNMSNLNANKTKIFSESKNYGKQVEVVNHVASTSFNKTS